MMSRSNGLNEIPHIIDMDGIKLLGVEHPVMADLKEEEVYIPVMDPFMFVFFSSSYDNWELEGTRIVTIRLEDYFTEYSKYATQVENFPDPEKSIKEIKEDILSKAYEIRSKRLN